MISRFGKVSMSVCSFMMTNMISCAAARNAVIWTQFTLDATLFCVMQHVRQSWSNPTLPRIDTLHCCLDCIKKDACAWRVNPNVPNSDNIRLFRNRNTFSKPTVLRSSESRKPEFRIYKSTVFKLMPNKTLHHQLTVLWSHIGTMKPLNLDTSSR